MPIVFILPTCMTAKACDRGASSQSTAPKCNKRCIAESEKPKLNKSKKYES